MIMTIRTIEPMTRRQPFIMAMVTGAVAAVVAPVYGGPGVRTTLQFDEAVRVESALLADVDGDGARDLVLATGTRGDDFARHLQIFRRRPGAVCFPAQPDLTYELVPSVIAFGAGDVTAAPGEEIVLFTVRGAYAWETGAGVETLPRPLLKGEFLWQLPHQRKVFSWQAGLQDLDGDGLADIVFPEPEGYRIGLQRRQDGESSFLDSQWPRLPPEHFHQAPNSLGAQRVQAEARVREISIGLNLGQESGEPAQTELSVVEVVPAPNFKDFGGDGRPDLLALSGENLFVWTQGQGGFGRDPDVRQEFPIEMDAGRRIDLSFAAHADDLDGNGRSDCVILAGDRKSEDLRTQILVYLNGVGQDKTPEASLFGSTGVPQQVLLVGGIVGAVDLTDVDGDGARDLVLGAVKVDTIDAIRAVSSGTIEASLRVYLNHEGRFSREPDLTSSLEIGADEIEEVGGQLSAQFIPDLSGDGIRELLIRDKPDRIRIHLVRRSGGKLVVHPDPIEEIRINPRSTVLVLEDPAGGAPEILVLEQSQVLHVRFGA